MSSEPKYVTLKIPKELADAIDTILGKMGFRTRAEFTKEAIRKLLTEYKARLPALPIISHFNLDEDGVKILDRSLATKNSPSGRIIDVYFKQNKIWCEYCQSEDCRHIQYALTIPKVKEILRKKGWNH